MNLTKHKTETGVRWALNGKLLPEDFVLGGWLTLSKSMAFNVLRHLPLGAAVDGPLLAPIEDGQEVWACGVTYLRSREAREAESDVADVYERVYDAERPEIFFKSLGWRAKGHEQAVRIRQDSTWNVPEPELTLVVNAHGEIVGYTAGNDMSSRSIEGENPLYLPQAKSYDGSCALGAGIVLDGEFSAENIPITITINRAGKEIFAGESNSNLMKRNATELVDWLGRELHFPGGVFLMTGTGLVPPDNFTLADGDVTTITVGTISLTNTVEA